MARQKTINVTAAISNDDLEGTFRFDNVPDGYGGSVRELVFLLTIKDATSGRVIDNQIIIVDDHITAQERSDLNSIMVKLRNAAFDEAGYNEV